jgi:hypothetical protein
MCNCGRREMRAGGGLDVAWVRWGSSPCDVDTRVRHVSSDERKKPEQLSGIGRQPIAKKTDVPFEHLVAESDYRIDSGGPTRRTI